MADDCLEQFCQQASISEVALKNAEKQLQDWLQNQQQQLTSAQVTLSDLLAKIGQYGQVFDCVLTGPVGGICQIGGVTHLTLAEALNRLEINSVGAIAVDEFTAIGNQTVFTLGAAVSNPAAIDVSVNASLCYDSEAFSIDGDTLTFFEPLRVGDEVVVRRFTV